MVTLMNEELRIPPHVVEATVNHVSGLAKSGVAGVYNRALYLGERQEALNQWAAFLQRIGYMQIHVTTRKVNPAVSMPFPS